MLITYLEVSMKNLFCLTVLVLVSFFYFQEGFLEKKETNKVLYCVENTQNCTENYRAPAVVMDSFEYE